MIVKILSVKGGDFKGQDGSNVNYYWVKAEMQDGTKIEFGTKNDYSDVIDEQLDLNIEKTMFSNGKKGFKEVN